jgi:hypothetical protein
MPNHFTTCPLHSHKRSHPAEMFHVKHFGTRHPDLTPCAAPREAPPHGTMPIYGQSTGANDSPVTVK